MSNRTLRARTAQLCALLAASFALLGGGTARATGLVELEAVAGAYSAGGGTIPVCLFTSAQLQAAINEAGGDIQQYGTDLLAAIQRALQARASGACDKHPQSVIPGLSTTAAPPPSSPAPTAPAPQAAPKQLVIAPPPVPPAATPRTLRPAHLSVKPVSTASGAGLPAPLWLLAGALSMLAASAALALTWRRRGWDPIWVADARHAWAEAGFRASALWSELGDWARLQR